MQGESGVAPNTKDPFTMEMFHDALPEMDPSTLAGIMERALIDTGISFMLRISEVIRVPKSKRHHLRRNCVKFSYNGAGTPTEVTITILSSKTSKIKVDRTLTANGTSTCVVNLLHRYVNNRPDLEPTAQLFQYPPGRSLPTRESVSFLLQQLAYKASGGKQLNIATHSMRRGGATTLCQRVKLPGYVIKNFGRWSNDEWEKVYQGLTTISSTHISDCLRPFSV